MDVVMPQLSDQMEQGTIISWLIEDGEPVSKGDELLEIETDKATVTYEAEDEGVLEIVAGEGETVAVGAVIARLGGGGESQQPSEEPQKSRGDSHRPEPVESNGSAPSPTPLAKRAAAVHEIDLAGVSGTGPRGRITKGDVLAAAGVEEEREHAPEPEPEPAPAPAQSNGVVREPTRLQQIVARRMTEAAAVPHFQVATEVVMDEALDLRAKLKAAAGDKPAPSVNDLIVKACALALRDHPLVNGSYTDKGFELHEHIHMGIAVATDQGLLVATLPDTDTKSLTQIAVESRELAEAARSGKATPSQLSGATFTVSNLGMFGMTQITAVINPPQAAILGVGATRATLARGENGEIVDRSLLTLNLSCDHRILNGADGSRFLADVRDLLQQPHSLAF
jgi:pyruvate dehydrogenase E2 component (dihydrolipoamide acetyltransferase)